MTTTMVDTFGCSIYMPFPEYLSNSSGWNRDGNILDDWKTIKCRTLTCIDLINTATVKVQFLERNFFGEPQVNIQVSSLPKVFCDNNFLRPSKIIQDFLDVAAMIQEKFGIPDIDILHAHFYRLDVAAVFSVKKDLAAYLQIISQSHHSERGRHNYCNSQQENDNGTEFFSENKRITSKFYDILLRTKDPRANGLLKYELSIINSANIRNYIRTPHQLVGDLSEEMIKGISNEDISKIGLDRPLKHFTHLTDDLISKIHRKKYDVYKFRGVYEYICENWKETNRHLAQELNVTEEIIRDRRNEIISMGGPFLVFGKKAKKLPGLFVQ